MIYEMQTFIICLKYRYLYLKLSSLKISSTNKYTNEILIFWKHEKRFTLFKNYGLVKKLIQLKVKSRTRKKKDLRNC